MALSYLVTCLDKHSVMYLVLILPGKVHCGVYLADLKGGVFLVKGRGWEDRGRGQVCRGLTLPSNTHFVQLVLTPRITS